MMIAGVVVADEGAVVADEGAVVADGSVVWLTAHIRIIHSSQATFQSSTASTKIFPTNHVLWKAEAVLAEEVTLCILLNTHSVLRAAGAGVHPCKGSTLATHTT